MLREIAVALTSNVQLVQLFAELCDLNLKVDSVYHFDVNATCLQFFLLFFGCFMKDLSLKYTHTEKKADNNRKKLDDGVICEDLNERMDELNEALDITRKES